MKKFVGVLMAVMLLTGADATVSGTETLVFDAGANPGTYYLILDGYSSTGYEGI